MHSVSYAILPIATTQPRPLSRSPAHRTTSPALRLRFTSIPIAACCRDKPKSTSAASPRSSRSWARVASSSRRCRRRKSSSICNTSVPPESRAANSEWRIANSVLVAAHSPLAIRRLLPRLGRVPQRVHFGERRVLRLFPVGGQCLLDRREAALEFPVGLPQHRFRIGAQMAREIDGGKQKIADFAGGRGCVAIERGFDFIGFLADFVQHCPRIVPIEADFARLGLQLERPGKGRERDRYTGQCASVLRAAARGFLLRLDPFPQALDR